MERRVVVTLCEGDLYRRMAEVSHPTISAYADRIGASFMVMDGEGAHSSPHWGKLRLRDLLNSYDRIVYVDTDVIIRDDAPDLFDEVPAGKLGVFDEAPFTDGRFVSMTETCRAFGVVLGERWDGVYFNSGVMVLSPLQRTLFESPPFENDSHFEQGYLNVKRVIDGIQIHPLHHKLNRMSCMDDKTGEARHDSFILHYAGHPFPESIPDLMSKDLEVWRENSPDYKFKRRIWVDVQGGLGDQVEAEPAIRFMRENIFKEDDMVVTAHWPRLFQHIDCPVHKHGEARVDWDGAPWHAVTLPGPETPQWSICSHMLCHSADYTSMAILHRTLPLEDKTIRLEVLQEDLEEVSSLVGDFPLEDSCLVHAGRHWQSKTFPSNWWQGVVDGLVSEGLRACLIGQDTTDGDRGFVPIEAREGVLDTRNRLSLGGLIAIISRGRCLVSNDSSPIHIAGAFGNWIVLIPSCKHPDHVLPYRNGTPY